MAFKKALVWQWCCLCQCSMSEGDQLFFISVKFYVMVARGKKRRTVRLWLQNSNASSGLFWIKNE